MPEKTIKVTCISNALYNGELIKAGSSNELPEAAAKSLLSSGRFVKADDPKAEKATEEAKAAEKADKPKAK